MEGAGGDTHFVVIDQDAIVKAMAQTPASGPIGAQMLLDLVDRAAGRPLSAASTAPRSDAAIGCVDWYHFEHDAR